MKEINEQDYDLIQRYHNYELNDKERTAVFERIKTDSTFKYHLHNIGLFREVLDESEDLDKSKTLDNWETILQDQDDDDEKAPPTIKPYRYVRYIMAMAAAILLAVITWGVWDMNEVGSMEYAQAEYKTISGHSLSIETRGDDNSSADIKKAVDAYNNGQYSEAIKYFKLIPASSEMYERACLWQGQAYMQTKDWSTAIQVFQQINDPTKYAYFREDMLWSLALSHIFNEEPAKAKLTLQELIKENPRKENAQLLLEKLD